MEENGLWYTIRVARRWILVHMPDGRKMGCGPLARWQRMGCVLLAGWQTLGCGPVAGRQPIICHPAGWQNMGWGLGRVVNSCILCVSASMHFCTCVRIGIYMHECLSCVCVFTSPLYVYSSHLCMCVCADCTARSVRGACSPSLPTSWS